METADSTSSLSSKSMWKVVLLQVTVTSEGVYQCKTQKPAHMLPAYAVVHLWLGQAREALTCLEVKHSWTQFCGFEREMDPSVLLAR